MDDARGKPVRIGERGQVLDPIRVEHHQVGERTGTDPAPRRLIDLVRRRAGHPADRVFQGQDLLLPDVAGQYPRERAIGPRMRKALAQSHGVAVGFEHGGGGRHDPDHVGFIHRVEDRVKAAVLDLQIDQRRNRRFDGGRPAPLGQEIGQGPAVELRVPRQGPELDTGGAVAGLLREDPAHLGFDPGPRGRIGHPAREFRRAAGQGPGREHHVGVGAEGSIGIEIHLDIEPGGPGRVHHGKRPGRQAELRRARDLVVVDLGRDPRLPRDPDHLGHRGQAPGPFVPHVGHIDAAVARRHPGQRDHFVGAGIGGRDVFEPGGKTERPVRHRSRHHGPHPVQLGRGGRPVLEPQDLLPDPGVPGKETDVRRHPERGQVRRQRPRLVGAVEGRQDGGDPLADEILLERKPRNAGADVRVIVDEARRHHQPRHVHHPGGPGRVEARRHGDDPVAADRHVGLDPRGAGAVHHRAAPEQHIVARLGRSRSRGRQGQRDGRAPPDHLPDWCHSASNSASRAAVSPGRRPVGDSHASPVDLNHWSVSRAVSAKGR